MLRRLLVVLTLAAVAAPAPAQLGVRFEHRRDRTEVFVPADDDPAQNGNRLLTVVAELGRGTAERPTRLRLGPGVYDLGGRHLELPAFLDLEGAGSAETVLTARGSDAQDRATVLPDPDSSLSRLRVLSRGEARHAVALRVLRGAPRVVGVALEAFGAGATATALVVAAEAAPRLVDLTARARAEGLGQATGARVEPRGAPQLLRVELEATGDRGLATGLDLEAGAAPSTLEVQVRARSTHGPVHGVVVGAGARAELRAVRIHTESGRWNAGLVLAGLGAMASLQGSTVLAEGGKLGNAAVQLTGHGARLHAEGSSIEARGAGRAVAIQAREADAAVELETSRVHGEDLSFETARGVTLETACTEVTGGLVDAKGRFKCRTCAGVPLSRCN